MILKEMKGRFHWRCQTLALNQRQSLKLLRLRPPLQMMPRVAVDAVPKWGRCLFTQADLAFMLSVENEEKDCHYRGLLMNFELKFPVVGIVLINLTCKKHCSEPNCFKSISNLLFY